MKRFLSVTIICALLFQVVVVLVCSASGVDSTLTKEDAEALLKRGFAFYEAIHYSSTTTVSVDIVSYEPFTYKNLSIKESYVELGFTKNSLYISADDQSGRKVLYNEISPTNENSFFGRKIASLSDVNSMLGEMFSDSALARVKYDRINKAMEKFVVGENGNVYMLMDGELNPRPLLCEYGELKVDGDKATMIVTLGYNRPESDSNGHMIFVLRCDKVTVDFEKNADGWRISGGELFDKLYYDLGAPAFPDLTSSPNTSDSTSVIIALLVLSGASLAGVAAVKRKRR